MSEIVSMIGSLGFPIVVSLILLSYVKSFFNSLSVTLSEIKSLVLELKEVIKNEKTSLQNM